MRSRFDILAIAALALAAACGGSGGSDATTGPITGTTGGTTGGSTGPTATTQVSVGTNVFQPSAIQVSPGATVTWTWAGDAITHNVTFTDGSGSGDKNAGATFQKTFSTAGTFQYRCTIHAGMNGSVLVQ